MKKMIAGLWAALLLGFAIQAQAATPEQPLLKMATTTSTDNSGLLKVLLPAFQEATGYEVQVIAVGTGKALKMGETGDVDVVLVHARGAEDEFVAAGHGEQRYDVMYNDFVLVGPAEDPAAAKGKSVAETLQAIAETKAIFVSRGDDSGTHKMEKKLWKSVDLQPEGEWYREAGQGMGKVLQMAGELGGYTLTDRGTWLAYMDKSPLQIISEGDEKLFNPYGIIPVSQKKYPDINHTGAQALTDWLISPTGQQLIADFKINGQPLFIPSATPTETKAE